MRGSVLHDSAKAGVEEHAQPADLVAIEYRLGVRAAPAILLPELGVLPLFPALLDPFERTAQREARGLACENDRVRTFGVALRRGMYRRERGAKGEAARLACGQPDDQRLVGKAGEVFAREGHTVLRIVQR